MNYREMVESGIEKKETMPDILGKLSRIIEDQDEMILNAFQLVKNGKSFEYLKFNEFKQLIKNKHDHNGNIVKK